MKGSRFLLPALFKTIVLPPLLVYLFLCLPILNLTSSLVPIPTYIISFPLLFILRSYLSLLRSQRHARSLGAIDTPRVKGRWPLNLDVLRDWARSGSEEEVGRMMVLLERKYGKTYNTRVLGEDQIISSDPAVLKHVLISDFDNFVKGQKFKDRAEAFLGDGIFNSDGERWKFHRALLRPFFHPTHVSAELFTTHVDAFLSSIPISGEAFDIQARLGQLSLEMAVMWMCGEDMSSVPMDSDPKWIAAKEGLGKAMTDAQRVVGRRVKIGTIWPLFEMFQDPLKEPMTTIRTFFEPIIDRAIERKRQRQILDENEDIRFIDRLVDVTDDRKLVEDQLINILLASRDTLASCLTFCVYSLALHPDIAKRVREEVRQVAGQEGAVTKDVIRDLRYSRAFINEVLRLFPPVPLNIRRTLRPSLLPTSDGSPPMYMPANTSIIIATVLSQRDHSVWGEDAGVFDPDRWLDGKLSQSEREGFISWNIGPRMCLGQSFALTAIQTFLVLLSRQMDRVDHAGEGKGSLKLVFDAQSTKNRIPDGWTEHATHDGRARGGRDRMWVVADVVLAIKGGLWVHYGSS
ncbi:hypothetical protein CI109_102491 [Kwoniella shandongensis]|uniref:Uncharacterized protein n=1 Tax=Kwoniella shandongensis TaxID=1734106 RepID=A0A5M6BZV8_9TREE|nr:uncharacterized protein CI109_003191 [Kwoniella shandongensis]KAA5528293.1 hypothetical protein CI109_003191 [Kwoniella shandongensis]